MTEAQPHWDPDAAWTRIEALHAARDRLAAEALPANKAALFDALAAAGVTHVAVSFDGCGDSGQIENIEAHARDEIVALPATEVEIASAPWEGSELERRRMTVAQAIETLAYAFLAQTHGGWENNEGAYGEFVFDVATRTITLDYNERFIETESHEHEF